MHRRFELVPAVFLMAVSSLVLMPLRQPPSTGPSTPRQAPRSTRDAARDVAGSGGPSGRRFGGSQDRAQGGLLSAWATSSAYDPNELSYGIYWFGLNNANQKFVSGESKPYFDPAKPTLIYVHGWQPYMSNTLPNFDYNGTDTAAAWINDGWNVGVFVWNQFSDELVVTDAEAKIWTPNGPKGMRWRDWDDWPDGYGDPPPGTPSAAELFYDSYVAAMTEYEYTGGNIRIAGHSLGGQMAVRLTRLVHDGIAAGEVPEHLRPTRVALLDPYWSPGGKSYLGGGTTGDAVRERVADLLPTGTLFEWYRSSNWTAEPVGDSNDDLKPMMMYTAMDPTYAESGKDKHMAAKYLYFWSYAFDGPPECSGDACLGDARMLSRMSDARLAALMRSDYTWAQSAGTLTATPDDDTYQSGIRADAPYTATQLTATPISQAVGSVITVTATVSDTNNTLAGDGTLVAFGTDVGTISARSATNDGNAVAHLTSDTAGRAHVTATTQGTGGTIQNTVTVTICQECDFDCDCEVDVEDVNMVAGRWRCDPGDSCDPRFDLDDDGDVDVKDVMITAAQWGQYCD